jgi:hypothetical protein
MKATSKSSTGTSFHGTTINASVEMLMKAIGKPSFECNDGEDKVNYEWIMETDAGDVFTIYDWKEYVPLGKEDMVEFHIGGRSEAVTQQAREEITNAIAQQQ